MAGFVTFNMHGFNNDMELAKKLCEQSFVVCLQEHWLRSDQLSQLNACREFGVYALSFIPVDTAPSFCSRPYGSLAVFMRNSAFNIMNIGYSVNQRVQVLLPSNVNGNILLLNVYFPSLSSSSDYATDLDIICGFTSDCIVRHTSQYQIICGDLKASWEIIERDVKLSSFKRIVTTYGLHPSSELHTGDMLYFFLKARGVFTWIDNIFILVSLIN